MLNILVLNGSPAGENSITLQTLRFLELHFPDCEFRVLHVGQRIRAFERDFSEAAEALQWAELLLFCYPVYTFLVPAQLHRFLELIGEQGVDLRGRVATQLTTSKHFYDTTAHRFIQDNCDELGLRCVRGLSADMDDLLTERGQREALAFFRFLLWSIRNRCYEPRFYDGSLASRPAVPVSEAEITAKNERRVAVVADTGADRSGSLRAMLRRFEAVSPAQVQCIDLQDVRIDGGCLGCFRCAADGVCVYRDGFSELLRERIQSADAIVYAFTLRDHSMGSRFKLFDDRQFCNGHRTVTMGKPVGYLISGELKNEPNLRELIEARAQVGGNFLAGIATDRCAPDAEIDCLARSLDYAAANGYQPPRNFYGVGGMKIFRDLIWQMQGLMREDHRFYKAHGFYDFPQKHRGRLAAMYLVGAMLQSPALRKKLGGGLSEGMLAPYRSVLRKAEKKK